MVFARTMKEAQELCEQREREIAEMQKRERQEEMAAIVRLLDLSGYYEKTKPTS